MPTHDPMNADVLAWVSRCRKHGAGCVVPWGYNPDHTDSDRPYTLDELNARREAPHRYAYPTLAAYLEGFHLWRALRRDARPNRAEADVLFRARLASMAEQLSAVQDTVDGLVERLRSRQCRA